MTEKKAVEVHEAQSHLKEILSLVGTGIEVLITEGDTPIARLLPVESGSKSRVAGLHKGAIWTSEDFDAPLPETFWMGEK